MADIELKNVSKEYDLHTFGIAEVSLQCADGSVTSIIGAPGCGKSTLLFCIGGLVDITSGELLFDGVSMNYTLPKERNVFLMREGQIACRGSVYDNISYGLRLRSVPRAEIDTRVQTAADILGLTHKLKTNIKKLSELDRRRVSLARGLARKPSIIMLDEPLFNISDEDRLALAGDIKKVHSQSGLTFIIASSFGADAFLFGGRVAVMKEGKITCTGSESELTDSPPDMFTAALLGEDPMSFFAYRGERIGVRRGGLVLSADGDIEAEIIAKNESELLVKPDPESPAIKVSTNIDVTVGDTLTVSIINGVRFDDDGKYIGKI